MMFALKNQGTELQAEAFRHADLLVVYGSSELEQPHRYHASSMFNCTATASSWATSMRTCAPWRVSATRLSCPSTGTRASIL